MELTGRVRFARFAFFWLAAVFAVCVAVQVLLAGMAIFMDPVKWRLHTLFVKIIEYLPLFMLIFGFMGRMPRGFRWQSAGLFLLIMMMYATANLASSLPIVGALHPVVALGLFWLALSLVPKAWRLVRQPGNAPVNRPKPE